MRRLVFVNRFYWPEHTATAQLLTDLAEALAARGWEVTVITSRPASAGMAAEETRAAVKIIRVQSRRDGDDSLGRKALAFGCFFLAATRALRHNLRRGDVLIVLTDPPLIGIAAAALAAVKGARLIHWVQDIYPEVATAVSGRRLFGVLKPARNVAWRSADRCVTLGPDMADVIARGGVDERRITVIPNWAPAGVDPLPASATVERLRRAWGLSGRFVVAYAGNLGRVHDLETIVGAAALLRDEARIVFLFVGGGARRRWLETEVRRQQLDNVQLAAAQPREGLGAMLAVGDLHLVTLRPGCEAFVFPSKIYGIAAAARPILFVGPPCSDPARVVREGKLGQVVPAGDARQLAGTIRALAHDPEQLQRFGEASRQFSQRGAADAATAWDKLLTAVEA